MRWWNRSPGPPKKTASNSMSSWGAACPDAWSSIPTCSGRSFPTCLTTPSNSPARGESCSASPPRGASHPGSCASRFATPGSACPRRPPPVVFHTIPDCHPRPTPPNQIRPRASSRLRILSGFWAAESAFQTPIPADPISGSPFPLGSSGMHRTPTSDRSGPGPSFICSPLPFWNLLRKRLPFGIWRPNGRKRQMHWWLR